ncbi:aqualysin-1-like [Anneissia japonica]|uniref:aqualysin-1-like n=1 Tax=Anneissia japonica TaxID=1529436 RepID=UPI00142552E9|nr:aqualysin-1-like [Anneissia japonica]
MSQVITVGATDILDNRWSFSNFGDGLNIFAPGVEVESLSYTSSTGTRYLSGTSMAAPHVSGVAAILLSQGTPANKVAQKIYDTSTKNVVGDPKGSNNRLLYVD